MTLAAPPAESDSTIWEEGGTAKLTVDMGLLKVLKEWRRFPGTSYGLEVHNLSNFLGKLYVVVSIAGFCQIWVFNGTTWSLAWDAQTNGYTNIALWPSKIWNDVLYWGGVFDGNAGILSYDGITFTVTLIPGATGSEIQGLAVFQSKLYAASTNRTTYSSATPTVASSWAGAFTLPAGNGNGGLLVVYSNKLYAADVTGLPALVDTTTVGKIYSWDGTTLTAVYTIPDGLAVQDCAAVLDAYLSGSKTEPSYLYIGTSSGDIIRFDGTTWAVNQTLDLPIVGLNVQTVGGEGRAGSHLLVATCGIFRRVTINNVLIPYMHGGSVWISDGVNWWLITKSPAACFCRSQTYNGLLLVSTLYHKERSHAAIYTVSLADLEILMRSHMTITYDRATFTLANNTAYTDTKTVPAGKIWVITNHTLINGDNVARGCNVKIQDADGNEIAIVYDESIGSGSTYHYPLHFDSAVASKRNESSLFPITLPAGYKVVTLLKAGGASAGGASEVSILRKEYSITNPPP